ncbi:MAG: hypothetical protein IPJ74_24950 [Saprospiraceae bacterium]|nr:hypothetical protein [Saprospiraceae bacterium]
MAMENRISATLTPEQVEAIRSLAQQMEAYMPFLISLSPEERQSLPKSADKTVSFLGKSLDYSQHNPQFLPAFMDVYEFDKDVNISEILLSLARPLRALVEKMEDTAMLASSEAYIAALFFYRAVKAAAKLKVPGAQAIYDDLKVRFPGKPRKRSNGNTENGTE